MKHKTRIAAAIGASLITGSALAVNNPFAIKTLESGYQLAQADTKQKDGKCGEAKCAANKAKGKTKEASCGADKKSQDGNCGANKKAGDGNCGANKKTGDGSCGGNKK